MALTSFWADVGWSISLSFGVSDVNQDQDWNKGCSPVMVGKTALTGDSLPPCGQLWASALHAVVTVQAAVGWAHHPQAVCDGHFQVWGRQHLWRTLLWSECHTDCPGLAQRLIQGAHWVWGWRELKLNVGSLVSGSFRAGDSCSFLTLRLDLTFGKTTKLLSVTNRVLPWFLASARGRWLRLGALSTRPLRWRIVDLGCEPWQADSSSWDDARTLTPSSQEAALDSGWWHKSNFIMKAFAPTQLKISVFQKLQMPSLPPPPPASAKLQSSWLGKWLGGGGTTFWQSLN